MRLIKLGLLSVIFLLVVITLISLLIPSNIRLSRATNLPNQRERIFVLLEKDSLWHPAYGDSASAKGYSILAKKMIERTDSTYVVQWQQAGRKPVRSGWQVYGEPSADSITLQWYMDFDLGWFPSQKFSSMFYESTYGAMMEKGLYNIKQQFGPY